MSEEKNIEERPEDGKTGSLEENPGENISPPETIEQIEPQIEKSDIPKSEIENMEVHHHPHVEKKNFKEYLLEGLMIFLAVTMGFFAESLREYTSEHTRAKEYAATMLNDLTADTADLKDYISYMNYAAANVDTLMQLLSNADPLQIPSGRLYWYGLFGGATHSLAPHDATLLEMKSSGSLRYFSNPVINRNVAQYDQFWQVVKTNSENDQGIYTEVRKARAQLFYFKYNEIANSIYQQNRASFNWQRIDSFVNSDPPLLSSDKTAFNQYIEMVRSRYLKRKSAYADTLLQRADILIVELKKEYGLENE